MDLDRVHPELRRMARRAPRMNVQSTISRRVARLATRRLLPAAKVPGVAIRDVVDGAARLRLYTPDRPSGAAMVWVHGGGMVIGGPRQDDRLCAETAAELGVVVASVDYRMAPEHPFPLPQQDCLAVWTWLQAHAAPLGVDPTRVAVAGASAGGGLAASAVNALRDAAAKGASRLVEPAAQWLLYPMLDDRTAARIDLDAVDHFVWNNAANRFGWTALLLGTARPGDDAVPAAAAPARRTHLAGLPPTWIGVGDIDLFHDEDVAYAERLNEAGVAVTLDVVPGAPHGFETLGAEAAVVREFVARGRAWLADALA
ncbi:alpha/beta hydrolase [Microbacterium sp. NPDC096154]|uniref:alpha/beta hydrolase n=1 Tax=Microbacterium sp. NPDC096154 TaxID=3155549 RepID=UPI00331B9CFB